MNPSPVPRQPVAYRKSNRTDLGVDPVDDEFVVVRVSREWFGASAPNSIDRQRLPRSRDSINHQRSSDSLNQKLQRSARHRLAYNKLGSQDVPRNFVIFDVRSADDNSGGKVRVYRVLVFHYQPHRLALADYLVVLGGFEESRVHQTLGDLDGIHDRFSKIIMLRQLVSVVVFQYISAQIKKRLDAVVLAHPQGDIAVEFYQSLIRGSALLSEFRFGLGYVGDGYFPDVSANLPASVSDESLL